MKSLVLFCGALPIAPVGACLISTVNAACWVDRVHCASALTEDHTRMGACKWGDGPWSVGVLGPLLFCTTGAVISKYEIDIVLAGCITYCDEIMILVIFRRRSKRDMRPFAAAVSTVDEASCRVLGNAPLPIAH